MKVWFILLSVLAAVATWCWHTRPNSPAKAGFGQRVRLISRSFLTGIAVYFCLMGIALIYMTIAAA
ncbi:hypothetical protein CKA81_07375 [Pollutimonas thiosulfatoxidans]|uniref:Uncharacterized protein n=1 Tax=Pollutimonas thiosulfatoxidans TaxID=2028345 RepID=A0A410GBK4_9BURK|nr:hypothetical protein CKA81_07375 [Pollutimonas thiosulfatoxidans]